LIFDRRVTPEERDVAPKNSTLGRELDGVRQQVQHDLSDLSLVRLNLAKPVIDVGAKCD